MIVVSAIKLISYQVWSYYLRRSAVLIVLFSMINRFSMEGRKVFCVVGILGAFIGIATLTVGIVLIIKSQTFEDDNADEVEVKYIE